MAEISQNALRGLEPQMEENQLRRQLGFESVLSLDISESLSGDEDYETKTDHLGMRFNDF